MFDRLPRSAVRIGDRAVPVYLVTGIAGVVCGSLAMSALALLTGASLAVTIAVVPASVATFIAVGLIRRALTGVERHVLWEGLYASLGVTWAIARAADVPVAPYLDLAAVGLAALMIWGRIGCTMCGCCHGAPARIGILYPRECGVAERRLPVQLIECAGWSVITAIAATLALVAPPGRAVAWVLVAYGVLRLGLEPLRGDRRARVAGVTEAAALSVIGIAIGIAIVTHEARARELAVAAGGAVIALGLAVTARRWLARMGPTAAQRAALARHAAALATAQVWTEREGPYVLTARREQDLGGPTVVLEVAAPGRALSAAEAAIVLEAVARPAGLVRGPLAPIATPTGHRVVLLVESISMDVPISGARPPPHPAAAGYFDAPS